MRPRSFLASWALETARSFAALALFIGIACAAIAFVQVPGFGSPWQWMTTRPFTKERVEQSQVIAADIVAALERHREVEGAYPDDLSDLEPRYIEDVPLPTAGCREWGYRVEDDGFVLEFYRPGEYPVAWYRSATGRWCIDD